MQMNITVDMEEYTEGSLLDEIATRVARDYITQDVRARLNDRIKQLVDEEYKTSIKEKVAEIIETKVSEGIQPTNIYGEPVGQATNLREIIAKKADEFMSERVNKHGDTAGYHDREARSRIDWYVRDYAREELDKAIKAQIDSIKQNAIDSVKDTVSALMAQKLAKKCDPIGV